LLIDEYLPDYDANEVHQTVINAPIDRVYPLVRSLDLRFSILSPVFRGWQRLARWRSPGSAQRGGDSLSLQSFLDQGFVLLAEQPPHEMVIGLTERVGLGERVRVLKGDEFKRFNEPGFAKAAWNFSLEPLTASRTRVTTETRVLCMDAKSRHTFRIYWRIIRLGSGLIRLEFLRALKRAAERP
jgi:hypothetical protein